MIDVGEPLAVAATEAVRTGDVATLKRLLRENPGLAECRVGSERDRKRDMSRTLLHVVTDWPGHFPNGVETVRALIEAGADVDARFSGPHTETPLHWAASSDDVDVLDALLDAGADIEARGAVIGGGTPMADATAFGQWGAARRLLERGAATTRWEASALGLLDRVKAYFVADAQASQEDATACLWGACHGGHLEVAEYLVERGADMNWVGWDDLTALDVAERSEAADVVEWLSGRGAKRAADLTSD
jgi:uncharacterized protein